MDIAKFCAAEDGRYPLSKPWIRAGWRYATDGRIAVREPTNESDSLWDFYDVVAVFDVSPLAKEKALAIIPTHDGKYTKWRLPACETVETPSEKTCKYWGECDVSEGAGCPNMVDGRTSVDQYFAGKKWNGAHIDLINKQLPGALYTVTRNGWMRFVCGQVEGMLAPMKG